jgi:protein phosphatase
MDAVANGVALCVPGNHDIKLVKALKGQDVTRNHGLKETMEQLDAEPQEFRDQVREFLYSLVSHQVVDDGNLCVAHAGLHTEMQGRGSSAVREFCLYGETTGEIDEFGLPVRYEWAKHYQGKTLVVFGHTPVPEAEFFNNTIDIDTGCCFGGKLTALRYPERELVSVPAARAYAEPARPIRREGAPRLAATDDGVLDIDEVLGRRTVETSLGGRVIIREENAIAALEVMSRFAADPRWLVYLPPTMSPCQTSLRDGYLEHPAEALQYYRESHVTHVVCEEKHMGSRAVAVVCRNADVARTRFDVDTGEIGIITTRTGRRFFSDPATESQLLTRIQTAAELASVFAELSTEWLVIDLELMPWSASSFILL